MIAKIFRDNLNDNQSSGIDLSTHIEKNKEKNQKKYLSIIKLISNSNLNGLCVVNFYKFVIKSILNKAIT